MPRKILVKPVESTEPTTSDLLIIGEPKVEERPKLPKGMVKVKVLVGTLRFEEGTFQKGDVFETSRKRALQFDANDVQLV